MFKKIVIVEPVLISDEGKERLKQYCNELVCFETDVDGDAETIKRIGDADCILVSYKTIISRRVIEACTNLNHVALCCSYYGKSFAVVDIDTLEKRGITFSHLEGHGDNGVVEFTLAQTINLISGANGKSFKGGSHDLTSLNVGIVGLGNLGSKIARTFKFFGSNVNYYSRTRKSDFEAKFGLNYYELNQLLRFSDIISINVNRDVLILTQESFNALGDEKVIINTSVGRCYDIDALKIWLKNKSNFYICDKSTIYCDFEVLKNYPNVIYADFIVGDTKECYQRATEQIISNIKRASDNLK